MNDLPERVLEFLAKHGGWESALDYVNDLEQSLFTCHIAMLQVKPALAMAAKEDISYASASGQAAIALHASERPFLKSRVKS